MISILTVNYHSAEQVAELAASVRRHPPGMPWELIVTNNSPEEVVSLGVEPANSRFHKGEPPADSRCHIVDAANVGFAAGINLAHRRATGQYLMIANPDVRVTAGAIDRAVDALRSDPGIGIVLPRLTYPEGGTQPSVRRFYTWPVVLYARLPLRRLRWKPAFFRRYLYEELDGRSPADVDWGLGGAMFLRREDLLEDRVFDDRYFLYFEDVDLCLQMWRRGKRVAYMPEIECVHAHRRSSKNPLSLAGWHHFRSLCRFIIKHRGLPQRPTH